MERSRTPTPARVRRRHPATWIVVIGTIIGGYAGCGFPDHTFNDNLFYGRDGSAGSAGTSGGGSGGSSGANMDASSGGSTAGTGGSATTGGSGGTSGTSGTGGNAGATGGSIGLLDAGGDAKTGCGDGGCTLDCGQLTNCNGECVSTMTDERYCGRCDIACNAGEQCTNGQCVSPCSTGPSCNGECVDTDSDERYCGDCTTACAAGMYCDIGTCKIGCVVSQDLGSALGSPAVSGTNVGAADNATPPCQSTDSGEVAYRWTAPTTDTFTFDTLGSALTDTILWVVDGNCGGSVLACADDTFLRRSRVEVPLIEGQVVIIYVDSYGGSSGGFQLNIQRGTDGPCCSPQGTAGCAADSTVESCVCSLRSCCCGVGGGPACDGTWNFVCANLALNNCSACIVN